MLQPDYFYIHFQRWNWETINKIISMEVKRGLSKTVYGIWLALSVNKWNLEIQMRSQWEQFLVCRHIIATKTSIKREHCPTDASYGTKRKRYIQLMLFLRTHSLKPSRCSQFLHISGPNIEKWSAKSLHNLGCFVNQCTEKPIIYSSLRVIRTPQFILCTHGVHKGLESSSPFIRIEIQEIHGFLLVNN